MPTSVAGGRYGPGDDDPERTVRIEAAEIRRVALPLRRPFTTAFGTQHERDVALIRLRTDEGDGWGECNALPWPTYSAETTGGAITTLVDHLLPRLVADGPLAGPTDVGHRLPGVVGHRMAKAAVELAVLDAWLGARGIALATWLGATTTRVPCGVSVGIPTSIPELLEIVAAHLEEGYVRIKLKIRPGWDVDPVMAVREAIGPAVPLQVDANAAYRPADIPHLRRLDAADLLLVEQPFPEEAVLAHARLREVMTTPVCLDESATSAQVVADAISVGAVDLVNVKPGRVGGFIEAVRVHDVCQAHGIGVWCGGMVETGIGRAACAAFAAMPGCVVPGDNSASDRFFVEDIVAEPLRMVDGHLPVPDGPGIGVEVDEAALDRVTVERRTWTA